jgi:transcriptional regulator with XRE-family HTH domain
MTIGQLAQLAGVGLSTIGNFEQGKTRLSQEKLVRIADILKVSPAEIEQRMPNKKHYNLEESDSAGWLVRETFAEYLAVTDLEKALDRAREARDWKAVCALGCELARKAEKETAKAEGAKP